MSARKLYEISCDAPGCHQSVMAALAPSALRRKITGKTYQPAPWHSVGVTREQTAFEREHDIPVRVMIHDYCPDHSPST